MEQARQIQAREQQTSHQTQKMKECTGTEEVCNERWLDEGEFASLVRHAELLYEIEQLRQRPHNARLEALVGDTIKTRKEGVPVSVIPELVSSHSGIPKEYVQRALDIQYPRREVIEKSLAALDARPSFQLLKQQYMGILKHHTEKCCTTLNDMFPESNFTIVFGNHDSSDYFFYEAQIHQTVSPRSAPETGILGLWSRLKTFALRRKTKQKELAAFHAFNESLTLNIYSNLFPVHCQSVLEELRDSLGRFILQNIRYSEAPTERSLKWEVFYHDKPREYWRGKPL